MSNESRKETMTKKQFIKLIDDCIKNMGTKNVYHPSRLKPRWNKLKNEKNKLKEFERNLSKKDCSIGLIKLIEVNLCHKTLEAIIIEHPLSIKWLTNGNDILANCISKLSKFDNGKDYLISKEINVAE